VDKLSILVSTLLNWAKNQEFASQSKNSLDNNGDFTNIRLAEDWQEVFVYQTMFGLVGVPGHKLDEVVWKWGNRLISFTQTMRLPGPWASNRRAKLHLWLRGSGQ
jgi:hypothetical protein